MAYKLVHYINQFFAGIGGEDKADVSPEVRDGIVGPGMAFKAAFNGEAEIVATFICGDNYCANHLDDVAAHMVETVKAYGAVTVPPAGPCAPPWPRNSSSPWSAACTVKARASTCTARK